MPYGTGLWSNTNFALTAFYRKFATPSYAYATAKIRHMRDVPTIGIP
jgi:hypothetical protein